MTNRNLAAHVLRTLAAAQTKGQPVTLMTLTDKLKVRRADIREVIVALHHRGLVDARTMRLSLEGFAIGTALRGKKLPALRVLVRVPARLVAA